MYVTLYSSNHPCFSSSAGISEKEEQSEQPSGGSLFSLSWAHVLCGTWQWHCPSWVALQIRRGGDSSMQAAITHWLCLKFRDCLHLVFIWVLKMVWVESTRGILECFFSVLFPVETTLQAPKDPAQCWKEDLGIWVRFTFSFSWAPSSLRFWVLEVTE